MSKNYDLSQVLSTVQSNESTLQDTVIGPSSVINDSVTRFDTTTGKLIQDSVVTINDSGAIAGITSLNGTAIASFLTVYEIGQTVQPFDINTAKTDITQTFTAPQRIQPTIDNDGSFDLSINHDFVCTPSGAFTLTFTNRPTGQKGTIRLINTGGHAVTLGSNIIAPDGTASDLSTAGTYQIEYYSIDGTTVQIVASGALV